MKYPGLIREAAIAGGVGALFVASPLTGDGLGRATLAGLGVAAAVFAFRNRAGLPREPEVARAPIGSAVRALPLVLWLALPLWLLVFWPTLQWLWKHWTSSIWTNDHGVFMPPIIALLTYFTLRDDPDEQPAQSAWGFVWLALALALALTDAALHSGYLGALALIASLPGLSLLLLGADRTRRLAVPLALGLLMVPVPAAIATNVGLRHLTASSVEPLLQLFGYAAFRSGTVIQLQLAGGANNFVVADECSGISTLYAGVSLAIVLACYARSHAKRLALLAAVLPLAIGANVVRVFALILMSSGLGHWIMESPIHPLTGVATFAIVVGGLLLVAGRDPLGTLA